jgi:hypothetical protein
VLCALINARMGERRSTGAGSEFGVELSDLFGSHIVGDRHRTAGTDVEEDGDDFE